jgi:RHS repeat-associated protein
MSSPSFYSAAGNFIDAISGGVDPRTGLFNVSLPLVNIHPNNLAGPDVFLMLRYSPLSFAEEGFGRGFELNISRYDVASRRLHLSTGEDYCISSSGATIKQKKFRNFIFKKIDDLNYQIIYKSGLIEYLRRYDSVCVPVRAVNPDGRSVRFMWDSSVTPPRLKSVNDDNATVFCKITYNTATVFTVLPNDDASAYDIVFELGDGLLQNITSHALAPELIWTFDYDKVGPGRSLPAITGITTPTGQKETVIYAGDQGMAFPETAGLPALPRVVLHILSPGGGQPGLETRWTWTEKNYLGNNSGYKLWQPDIDPMLHIPAHDYSYGSTATMLDAESGSLFGMITRRYNSYHLQVSEITLREGKRHSVSTVYQARPGVHFDEQPAQFALPVLRTESWDTGNNSPSRQRITRWQFDEGGNPLCQESPDGTVTEYVYYPAHGEKDVCPADPHGFTRYLKRKTVSPRVISGDEVQSVSVHTWKKRDLISGEEGYSVVAASVEETAGSLKTLITRDYYEDINDLLTFGREKQRKTTLTPDIKKMPTVSYSRTEDFTYESREKGLFQSAALTSHDNLKLTRTTLRDPVLGHLLSETDAQGVITKYSYDKAGRILTRTEASGTSWEKTVIWSYTLNSTVLVTTATDPAGNGVKTFFDGAGREIKQEILDNDSSKKWFEVSSRTYNSLGQDETGVGSDWVIVDNSRKKYSISSETICDGWGNISRQNFSDGTTTFQSTDPVALTQNVYMEGRMGGITFRTARYITVMDERSRQPVSAMRSDTAGKMLNARSYKWDGLGRLWQMTDELRHTTIWRYDALGRVQTQILPDGTVVSRTYAPHLIANRVAAISIKGPDGQGKTQTWNLGTQQFDGLGRLTESLSGGRTTTYRYDDASPVPATIIFPSGKKAEYTYIPELGHAVSRMSADGVSQAFSYDPVTGNLLTAKEDGSEIRNTWLSSGNLANETFTQDSSFTAEYIHSLSGVMDTYTDIAGKMTRFQRNRFGRLVTTTDDALTVSHRYDALKRLSQQETTDNSTKAALTTSMAYDDFEREILRTISDSSGSTIKIIQRWMDNDLLAECTRLVNGVAVSQERYGYDVRNRLTEYTVSGSSLPSDAYSNKMLKQVYQYDALNNLTIVTTMLTDGSSDIATYHYENINDPTQLTSVTHTHDKYPQSIRLEYDSDGRMIRDEAGRALTYDVTGRLVSVSGEDLPQGSYGYDALNRLIRQTVSTSDKRQLFYRADELVNEVLTQKNQNKRLIKAGHTCLGVSDSAILTLTAGDHHDSLLWSRETTQQAGITHIWSPYGNGNTGDGLPGFNGERTDPASGTYHLGNGYRAYNPVLMRFNCPDNLSPFGAGGINPYSYCAGDPVNYTDPSGHISGGWAIAGIFLGALGLAFSVFTVGMSIAAAGGVMAALSAASTTTLVVGGLGVLSDLTAIASGAAEASDPKASAILGWVSLGTGLAGLTAGIMKGLRQVTKSGFTLNSSVAQDARYIALGHDISNVAPVSSAEQGIYFFDDVYKTQKRLNIVGHGQVDAKGVGYMTHYVGNNMVPVRGAGLRRLSLRVRSEEALASYKYIRLISCHSAEGAIPMGRQVMEAFGLETKAFHGIVEGLPAPMKILKDAVEHSPGGILSDLMNMEMQRMTFVGKGPHYRPQKFIPD